MGEARFTTIARSLRLGFLVERIIDQLEGRDKDYELREEVLEEGVKYFESAKRGILYSSSPTPGEDFHGDLSADLTNCLHLVDVDPELKQIKPEPLVAKLDEYIAALRAAKSGEGQIPEEIKKELIEFGKKLQRYENRRSCNLLYHSR